MTNPRDARLEALIARLTGLWEYKCVATSPTLYEENQRARGGRMVIRVRRTWVGVVADIEGERLWVSTEEDKEERRTGLPTGVSWGADGGVVILNGRLWFKYAGRDLTKGWTADTFEIDKNTLHLGEGQFVHLREDGGLVSGTVTLRKMDNPLDLKWAPDEVFSGEELVAMARAEPDWAANPVVAIGESS